MQCWRLLSMLCLKWMCSYKMALRQGRGLQRWSRWIKLYSGKHQRNTHWCWVYSGQDSSIYSNYNNPIIFIGITDMSSHVCAMCNHPRLYSSNLGLRRWSRLPWRHRWKKLYHRHSKTSDGKNFIWQAIRLANERGKFTQSNRMHCCKICKLL